MADKGKFPKADSEIRHKIQRCIYGDLYKLVEFRIKEARLSDIELTSRQILKIIADWYDTGKCHSRTLESDALYKLELTNDNLRRFQLRWKQTLMTLKEGCVVDDKIKAWLYRKHLNRCSWFQDEMKPYKSLRDDEIPYQEIFDKVETELDNRRRE